MSSRGAGILRLQVIPSRWMGREETSPLKTWAGISLNTLITLINSVVWICVPLLHMQIVYIQTKTSGIISVFQDGFCTNLESKDLNVIAYSNKNPVAYKIFILIGELIAYLAMLK